MSYVFSETLVFTTVGEPLSWIKHYSLMAKRVKCGELGWNSSSTLSWLA